jgi:SAM-dependent methyltransferase
MSPAESFPLYHPAGVQRAFSSDEATRRFAKVAQLVPGSRVLVLGCGTDGRAALLLADELGCSVLAADTDEAVLKLLGERIRAEGLEDRLETRKVALDSLDLPEAGFNGILIQGHVLYSLQATLALMRPLLAKRGRLGFTYPARVGRYGPKAVLDFWEKRTGAPLLLPRELLMALETAGFEPESVETLHDTELDALYRELADHVPSTSKDARIAALREELEQHKEAHGKANVSYAFAVGRRKEPGEKPPASRDRG